MDEKIITSNRRAPRDWEEILAAFESHLLRQGRANETVRAYGAALRAFGKFYSEQLKKGGPYVSRLQETDLYAHVDYLRSTRYAALSSINQAIAALRGFAGFLVEEGWHRRDIGKDLRTYRPGAPPEPKRLTVDEVRRLITCVDLYGRNGRRDHAILQVFLQCGLRLGELVRLSRKDLTLLNTTGKIRVHDEKGRSERVVPLNASARSALASYLKVRGEIPGDAPLFMAERGKRISTNTVQHLVKKYLCAIGRADLSVHDLRHHFAFELYGRIGKLPAVQAVLGHRSVVTTARYTRSTEKEISEAMEELPDNVYHGEHPKEGGKE